MKEHIVREIMLKEMPGMETRIYERLERKIGDMFDSLAAVIRENRNLQYNETKELYARIAEMQNKAQKTEMVRLYHKPNSMQSKLYELIPNEPLPQKFTFCHLQIRGQSIRSSRWRARHCIWVKKKSIILCRSYAKAVG
jgi:hypothetical protein